VSYVPCVQYLRLNTMSTLLRLVVKSITIRINDITKDRIVKYGKWGQSLDIILNNILDELEKKVSKADEKAVDDLANAALSASRKRGKK
jgi:hypothetical protein